MHQGGGGFIFQVAGGLVPDFPSGTVTFLFTDIEGSTRLWEHHPEAMRTALAGHDKVVESAIGGNGGVVFSKMGDGMAAAFGSARDALAAAVAAQRALAQESWPERIPSVQVRMGLHTGDGILVEGQYLNQPLNRCSRLMAIGHGGQILVSAMTEPLVRGGLPEGVVLVDHGEHRLRDLSEPIRVFAVRDPKLPSEFPPLQSLDAFPGNLPIQLSSFIGRDREIARVVNALRDERLITLTGVGGVGKTRLALQVAGEVLPRFREGAWLVELAPVRDPAGVADALAAVFGVAPRAGQSVVEALAEFLRTKQLLIILDNCEHLLDAVAKLVERFERACHGLVVLATSREGLALEGERIFAVPSLASPEAGADLEAIATADSVVLFVERAQRADGEFALSSENASAVAQVCQRLDGVPLAIELAAARVTAMTPTELARGLDHRFETLAGGRRGAVQRHQTLRAAIDWSYALCSEAEQRLLARLSVFSGGAAREAVEIVCQGPPIEERRIFEPLSGLVAKYLVVAHREGPETRYRLLETIREYGEERLADSDETRQTRSAHAEYYVTLARTLSDDMLGPRQPEAARHFEAERENLLAAMRHALDTADVDLALRLLGSLPSPMVQLGNPVVFPPDAISSLPGVSDHPLYPYAVAVAAVHNALSGELADLESTCEQALEAAERVGSEAETLVDPMSIALIVNNARGTGAMARGAMDQAATHWERSVQIAREAGRPDWLAAQLVTASLMYTMAGAHQKALPLATEGLDLARQVGRPSNIVMSLATLAGALVDDDPQRSRALLHESVELRAALGFEGYADASQILFTAAQLADWPLVLEVAPMSVRTLHWTAQWPSLGGILNVVARAIAPTDPDGSAVLQGVARRLVVGTHVAPVTDRLSATAGDVSAQRKGSPTFVTRVRRETTGLLIEALGEDRLHELRAKGTAMEDDDAAAYALEAIAKSVAMAGL